MCRHLSLAVTLLVTLLVPACSTDAANQPQATMRDSAGVVIVENRNFWSGEGGGWSIAAEPSLSIGTVQGEDAYQFFGVAGAHRFPDGRIAVVNAGSREVRVFDPDGVHLRSFGRRGEGPEEFEAPVLVGEVGDTLLVVDPAQHRLTLVRPDQGFVGVERVSNDVGGWLYPSGTFANGQIVFGGAFDMRRIGELKTGLNRAHTFYRSCRLDGSLAVDFGDKDGSEFFIKDLEGSEQDARPALIPFSRGPLATVSPDYFFFSDQDGYEIEAYEPSGRLARLIRFERNPVAVTPAHGERYVESEVEGTEDPEQAAAMRAYLSALPLPEFFPSHDTMLADREGYLWVADYQAPGAPAPLWSVFDPAGALVARLILPDHFYPLEIGEDYVLGEGLDEMDVEYIQLYSLFRAGTG
jgi:hypothetical protein